MSFELPRSSHNHLGRCLYTTYAALWTTADNTQCPNHPPYLLLPQHTAVHTRHTIMQLDTRRCLFVPPRCWSRSYFAVTVRKPAAIFNIYPTDFTSRIERMRSDARYTALLVARGDDDEFRHEDLASRKDNSTAYSSGKGRSLPAATVVRQHKPPTRCERRWLS